MPNIIEVQNLTKQYGSFTAVDDISFTVYEGETFGILGPNGAGKTTTLEMLEGLKPITSGQAILAGLDVSEETRMVKSLIGVQLQASSFFDGLNLKELVETFASLYGRNVNAMSLLDKVQLTDKAKSRVKELSGGQKQRLSIAVALVNDPKVIFLDEPTTGLDPQARRNLWELITEIKTSGKTVVITTHYMDEAQVLCDRIAIMDNAKISALDTTINLIKQSGVSSSIEFKSSRDIEPWQLEKLPAVDRAVAEHGRYQIISSDPQTTLPVLFKAAHDNNLKLTDLQLRQPTLEDVFLKFTGHELRE